MSIEIEFLLKTIVSIILGYGTYYIFEILIPKLFKKIRVLLIRKKKILIISHKRWGKDTLAEILDEEFGFKFESSSQSASDILIFDKLKKEHGYETPEECFEDRVNHREKWYKLICEYNKYDKAKLAKGILKKSDCYVGMRDRAEIDECVKQGLFDLIIWVDSSKRLEEEDPSSFNIDISYADIIIDNNGTLEEFRQKVINLGKTLLR